MVYPAIAYALLAIVLVLAAVTDWRTGKIFNWLTYPAVLAGIAYWTIAGLLGAEHNLVDALIGFSAGFISFGIILLLGGIGGGDVKLMAAVGALSAMWQVVLATTAYALVIAALMAVIVMIRQGVVRQTFRRLLGAVLVRAARVKPDRSGGDSPTVPFAAAVALGGLLAGAEQMLGLHTPWAWLGP